MVCPRGCSSILRPRRPYRYRFCFAQGAQPPSRRGQRKGSSSIYLFRHPILTPRQQFAEDKECVEFLKDPVVKEKLAKTKKLSEVSAKDYDAIFYIGGHGPILDLASDVTNAKLASEFWQLGKYVTAVCHGTGFVISFLQKRLELIS